MQEESYQLESGYTQPDERGTYKAVPAYCHIQLCMRCEGGQIAEAVRLL